MAKAKKEGAIDSTDLPDKDEKVRIKATPVGQPEQDKKDDKDKPMEVKAKPFGGEETDEEEAMEKETIEEDKEDLKKGECPKCKGTMSDGKCSKCGYENKGEMGGENPEEQGAVSANAEHSTSPNMGVPSTQHMLTPQSGIKVSRDQPKYPNEIQMKSVKLDMTKSPLFVEMSNQINAMSKALTGKIEAVEKSYNDRLANLQKTLDKFYAQPFYKAIDENVNPEALLKKSISEQIAKGQVEFR